MDVETALPSARARYYALLPQTDRSSKMLLIAVVAAQAAQLGVLLLLAHTRVASNFLQLLAAMLSAAVCLHRASRSGSKHERRLWLQLMLGFATWMCAQLFFMLAMFGLFASVSSFISDTLWLFFAFPLVLVSSATPQSSRRDAVAWLDTAQAFLFFGTLYALVFPRPGIITLELAYQVQSFAMLLAVALSYSTARRGAERELYRPLSMFVIIYAACSIGGYTGWVHGFLPGTLIDLCWTVPFSTFSIWILSARPAASSSAQMVRSRRGSPSHLRGVSALGLAGMSLVAAGVLAAHRTTAGSLAAAAVFLLFAARTSTREWQLQSAHEEQEFAALHDPLTKLANRALLEQELTSRLGQKVRPPQGVGLLFIDLDRFKTINDGLGHAFGDQLLIRIAALLEKAVRPRDIVARHGGDEFVVLLDQVEEQEAEALSRQVVERLREPVLLDGRLIHVTASIGLVMERPGASADSMLQDADCAMYKAKVLGKDRGQTFAPNMLVAAKRRLNLETDLRASLSMHAIEVQYQPIFALGRGVGLPRDAMHVDPDPFGADTEGALDLDLDPYPGRDPGEDLDTRQEGQAAPLDTIQGFEALARWRHPQRGMISPGDFIPIAEDSGLIIELGQQVLLRACHQCHAWNQRFGTRMTISVNVSALQFAHAGLLDDIKTTLRVTGLDPRLLKLEVTESVLLNGYHAAEEVLSGARALGIGVCLDDFGTGYSSLSYLLRFPFDVVKIDRSFVRHLDSDHRRAEMVRMLIQMASMLKKKTVAEGIETPAELARLRALGCDMVQGYLLSRPLVPEAIEQLLEGGSSALTAAEAHGAGARKRRRLRTVAMASEMEAAASGSSVAPPGLRDHPSFAP